MSRILVIEDNPVNMELATDLLETRGYEVLQAMTAEEGIQTATAESPDLILIDIALPGMDGLTAAGVLRREPRTAKIPIIALTAHAMHGDAAKAVDAGCVGYITKPIDTREFVPTVAKYLGDKG